MTASTEYLVKLQKALQSYISIQKLFFVAKSPNSWSAPTTISSWALLLQKAHLKWYLFIGCSFDALLAMFPHIRFWQHQRNSSIVGEFCTLAAAKVISHSLSYAYTHQLPFIYHVFSTCETLDSSSSYCTWEKKKLVTGPVFRKLRCGHESTPTWRWNKVGMWGDFEIWKRKYEAETSTSTSTPEIQYQIRPDPG